MKGRGQDEGLEEETDKERKEVEERLEKRCSVKGGRESISQQREERNQAGGVR